MFINRTKYSIYALLYATNQISRERDLTKPCNQLFRYTSELVKQIYVKHTISEDALISINGWECKTRVNRAPGMLVGLGGCCLEGSGTARGHLWNGEANRGFEEALPVVRFSAAAAIKSWELPRRSSACLQVRTTEKIGEIHNDLK